MEGQLRPSTARKNFELLHLNFSLDIDFREEFHWNAKQIFLWISADWETSSMVHSFSLWDGLILDQEQALMTIIDVVPEYQWVNVDRDLIGNQVNITVRWDVHPWVGLMTRKSDTQPIQIQIPRTYSKPTPEMLTNNRRYQGRRAKPKRKKKKKKRKRDEL